jgi:hypothetical protein
MGRNDLAVGLALVVAGCVSLLGSAAAMAQPWLDQPGVAGTQRVHVGTATVTLPPGEWVQVEVENRVVAWAKAYRPIIEASWP